MPPGTARPGWKTLLLVLFGPTTAAATNTTDGFLDDCYGSDFNAEGCEELFAECQFGPSQPPNCDPSTDPNCIVSPCDAAACQEDRSDDCVAEIVTFCMAFPDDSGCEGFVAPGSGSGSGSGSMIDDNGDGWRDNSSSWTCGACYPEDCVDSEDPHCIQQHYLLGCSGSSFTSSPCGQDASCSTCSIVSYTYNETTGEWDPPASDSTGFTCDSNGFIYVDGAPVQDASCSYEDCVDSEDPHCIQQHYLLGCSGSSFTSSPCGQDASCSSCSNTTWTYNTATGGWDITSDSDSESDSACDHFTSPTCLDPDFESPTDCAQAARDFASCSSSELQYIALYYQCVLNNVADPEELAEATLASQCSILTGTTGGTCVKAKALFLAGVNLTSADINVETCGV